LVVVCDVGLITHVRDDVNGYAAAAAAMYSINSAGPIKRG